MDELLACLESMLSDGVNKIIISNPINKSNEYKKIVIELINSSFHISKYTEKQVFHENCYANSLAKRAFELTSNLFKQVNGWSETKEHIVLISKKGSCSYKKKGYTGTHGTQTEHNRKKNYILNEGDVIPPLVDMGIFTQDGKIVKSMYSKYKQINRFLEIIDDEISKSGIKKLNVIDFGCGKSYLTFILYYYLSKHLGLDVNMIGLDLKKDVIEKCNAASAKYGYDNLRFELGDINGYKAPFEVDMVITLHACDTATDYALYNAVSWNAKYIFSVPCCQHELNEQLKPNKLEILSRYGIIKERFSALATDAIRGCMLEYKGYKTQLLEFIDLDHTPKNILIRAVKRAQTAQRVKENALNEVNSITQEFGFEPTICKLFRE